MSWLTEFPQLSRRDLLTIRKTLDEAYREFSRTYGESIENFFYPLLSFLVWFVVRKIKEAPFAKGEQRLQIKSN